MRVLFSQPASLMGTGFCSPTWPRTSYYWRQVDSYYLFVVTPTTLKPTTLKDVVRFYHPLPLYVAALCSSWTCHFLHSPLILSHWYPYFPPHWPYVAHPCNHISAYTCSPCIHLSFHYACLVKLWPWLSPTLFLLLPVPEWLNVDGEYWLLANPTKFPWSVYSPTLQVSYLMLSLSSNASFSKTSLLTLSWWPCFVVCWE